MNPQNSLSPVDLYRRRYAYDKLHETVLHAVNGLAVFDSRLWDRTGWESFYERAHEAEAILSKVFSESTERQNQHLRDLPQMSGEMVEQLQALDQKLLEQEHDLYRWFVAHDVRPAVQQIHSRAADWVHFDNPIDITFHFQPEMDEAQAETAELYLAWRFSGLNYRLCDGWGNKPAFAPPWFQFRQYCTEDLLAVERPEFTGLRSELLKATLRHVPELAYLAGHVCGCFLSRATVPGSLEWRIYVTPASGQKGYRPSIRCY